MSGLVAKIQMFKDFSFSKLFSLGLPSTGKKKDSNSLSGDVGLKDLQREDYDVAIALAAAFTKAVQTRREYIQNFESVRSFYLTHTILEAFSEDSLTPDIVTNEILKLSSETPSIQAELIKLQEVIDFDQLVDDIIFDLLSYGEYTLSMKVVENEGVVSIKDDVSQLDIIAFYDSGLPYKFLKKEKNDLVLKDPASYVHFAIGKHKLRINLEKEFSAGYKKRIKLPNGIPTYVRMGRPLLYGVLSKVKELQLLESLVPAGKLKQITNGNIVGIQVPAATDPKEALEIVKKYEDLLNKKVGVDRDDDFISVSDILTQAGTIKVIPILGEKGSLDIVDVRENRNLDDLSNSIQDARSTVLSSIGIPPAIIFGDDGPKSDILKRYSRYVRKLKSVQTAIGRGVLQVALAHLANKGIPVVVNDVIVSFNNELVNIDELDKMEFTSAVVGTIKDFNDFVVELEGNEQLKGTIDIAKYKEFLARQLSFVNQNINFVKTTENLTEECDIVDIGASDDELNIRFVRSGSDPT